MGEGTSRRTLEEEIRVTKEERQLYREAAKFLFEDVGRIASEHIQIPLHANVQATEDGAFVEAVVWVPKEEMLKRF